MMYYALPHYNIYTHIIVGDYLHIYRVRESLRRKEKETRENMESTYLWYKIESLSRNKQKFNDKQICFSIKIL